MDEWMAYNRFKLNQDKTDILWRATKRRLAQIDNYTDKSDCGINHAIICRTWFGFPVSQRPWHADVCQQACQPVLLQTKSHQKLPWQPTDRCSKVTRRLLRSFTSGQRQLAVSSLAKLDKLQRILNAVSRVIIYGENKFDHVTPLLRHILHWLRTIERVSYKLWLLTCIQTRHGLASRNIVDFWKLVASIASRSSFRSADAGRLLVPQARTKFHDRSLTVACLRAWKVMH